ncbi:MAG: DNA-binding response regulator, partial [Pseudomonadota bacterium]
GRATQLGLSQQGHAVDWMRDAESGRAALATGDYAAVLLDLGLPGEDGEDFLRGFRNAGGATPVLVVTARDLVDQRVSALDNGADDFIIKPFDLQELGARLRAVVRRAAGRPQPLLVHHGLRLDPAARTVRLDDTPLSLTPREFALLSHLLEHRGRVRSRQQLQDCLYDWSAEIESNAIEVHVHNLRRKLGRDLIRTVHGQGYTIDPMRSTTADET